MDSLLINFFSQIGLSDFLSQLCSIIVIILGAVLISIVINLITNKIILRIVGRVVLKTKTRWDNILLESGFFSRLSRIIPILILYFALPLIFEKAPGIEDFIQRIILACLTGVFIFAVNSFIRSINTIYSEYEISKTRPIKGYLQIVQILIVVTGIILIISTILNKSAMGLLTGIGAMSAVLMLIFKDSIMGLVAAIQLSGNDLIRIGDWVSIPDHGADGDVIDIKLQTVSIQNFDKTIVNVPIYSLVSSSFTNWRGMSESGGRRIKRHLNIDMNSIKFCSDELIAKLQKVELLNEHINQKLRDIKKDNEKRNINTGELINGRRMTNIGVFRAYIAAYLRNNPFINDSMTFLIRQLQPTESGIPLEIYVFSSDKNWINYENIQADIFDHLLAAVSSFELAVYQSPSGLDFREKFNTQV